MASNHFGPWFFFFKHGWALFNYDVVYPSEFVKEVAGKEKIGSQYQYHHQFNGTKVLVKEVVLVFVHKDG